MDRDKDEPTELKRSKPKYMFHLVEDFIPNRTKSELFINYIYYI